MADFWKKARKVAGFVVGVGGVVLVGAHVLAALLARVLDASVLLFLGEFLLVLIPLVEQIFLVAALQSDGPVPLGSNLLRMLHPSAFLLNV